MTRPDIYRDVELERLGQTQYIQEDAERTPQEWKELIAAYMGEYVHSDSENDLLNFSVLMLKVASLAVAAIENSTAKLALAGVE